MEFDLVTLFVSYIIIHSLLNFDFVLSHIAHFDKSAILPLFVLTTWIVTGVLIFKTIFLLSVFFLHFKQFDNFVF